MYFPYAGAILSGPTLHEISHNWATNIVPTYGPDNSTYRPHWGVSNAGGQLGGFRYIREVEQNCDRQRGRTKYQASFSSNETNPDGSFRSGFGLVANGGNGLPYSDIELYLMGMKSAQELRNSGFHLDIYSGNDFEYDGDNSFTNGYFYSRTKTSYTIDDIIAINGERIPDASSSQKQFKVLTVAISNESVETHYYNDIIDAVNWFAGPIDDKTYPTIYNFRQATYGVGSLVTNGISNSAKILQKIKLNKTSAILKPGQEEQLTATVNSGETVIWSSSNSSVATVSASGLVKAISKGSANITASVSSEFSTTCSVVVTTPPCENPIASGTVGTLAWFLCSNGTLTISGEGAMDNFSANYCPWIDYRNDIRNVIIEEKVTTIGSAAFYYCNNLASVTIPNSVTAIKDEAFYYCQNLASITIPNSVTYIGHNAFSGCNFTWVTIPESVTFISNSAFHSCTSLIGFLVDSENPAYSSEEGIIYDKNKTMLHTCPIRYRSTSVNIPDGVKTIGKSAFDICWNLASVTIPNSVTIIDESAFHNCSRLTSLEIPNSVTSIRYMAFSGCNNIKSLKIPVSVTYIGSYAFECSSLKEVSVDWIIPLGVIMAFGEINLASATLYVPAGTKQKYETADVWKDFGRIIEKEATNPFCDNPIASGITGTLTWTLCPDGTLTISGEGAMGDYSGKAPWSDYISDISTVIIEDKVTTIGNSAFSGLYNLTSVTIPNSVTAIGSQAFSHCYNLSSINIPNSVTYIGAVAFGLCNSITSIVIPSSVTQIGSYAFSECANLTSMSISKTVTLIEGGFINNCKSLTSIIIDAENPAYMVDDGVIYSKDKTLLHTCPVSKKGDFVIPYGVNVIGYSSFAGCESLTSVVIPNSVRSIESYSFSNCSNIKSITIPNSVSNIGYFAFSLSSLKDVIVEWTTPLDVNDYIFYEMNIANVTLHVPVGTKSKYAVASVWKDFATINEYVFVANPSVVTEVKAYVSDNILYINSPASESIRLYSASGSLLYSTEKQEGEIAIPLSNVRDNIIIITGSSGWVKKVYKRS